jgi:hypothetical protein
MGAEFLVPNAAPALWLPLGLVILGSHVLPRILGYLALALAAGRHPGPDGSSGD